MKKFYNLGARVYEKFYQSMGSKPVQLLGIGGSIDAFTTALQEDLKKK